VKLPDGVSDEVAAASLLEGMTVAYLVRRTFRVEPGVTVLWHAAAGSVGSLACQWLSHLGMTAIGQVGSDAKAEVARAGLRARRRHGA
jgi:NADPH2:quinone reductase